MKIQFEAFIVQVGQRVSIAKGEKYQNIVCRLDDTQYYEVRCGKDLFSFIKTIEPATKYVLECETRTSNFTHPRTNKPHFTIQLIALNIQNHESFNKREAGKSLRARHKSLELAIPWSSANNKK